MLTSKLSSLTDQDLTAPSPFDTPVIGEKNVLGMISFLIDREAYAIGQLGIMRKALGYDAMKYN